MAPGSARPERSTPRAKLEALLVAPGLHVMPCCFDALSARLIERAGFPLTFMSGFAVSAARLGLPDTGLISYGEMVDQGRQICEATSIPVIGDADTGYGNPLNVKRTEKGVSFSITYKGASDHLGDPTGLCHAIASRDLAVIGCPLMETTSAYGDTTIEIGVQAAMLMEPAA